MNSAIAPFPTPLSFVQPDSLLRIGYILNTPMIYPCSATPHFNRAPDSCPFPGSSAEIAEYLLRGARIEYTLFNHSGLNKYPQLIGSILSGFLDTSTLLLPAAVLHPNIHLFKLSRHVQYDVLKVAVMFSTDNLTEDSIEGRLMSLVGMFDWSTWACAIGIAVVVRLIVLLFNVKNHKGERDGVVAFLHNRVNRLLLLIAILGMFIIGLFQSALLSNLMVPQHDYVFNDEMSYYETLGQRRYILYSQYHSIFEDLFQSHNNSVFVQKVEKSYASAKKANILDTEQALDAVINGSGVIFGVENNLLFWSKRLCQVKVITLPLTTSTFGSAHSLMVFNNKVDDRIIERINQVISWNRAAINRITDRYKGRIEIDTKSTLRCRNLDEEFGRTKKPLSLDKLVATFGVIMVGYVIGFKACAWELVYSFANTKHQKKILEQT